MTSEIRFDGRVAIVTGAGAGLGRAHALELARRGAAVVVNDVGRGDDGAGADASVAQRVVDEIKAAGGTATANTASVSEAAAAEELVAQAVSEFGRLDILVNNAGVINDVTLVKMTDEQLSSVLDVHLLGAFYLTRPAFRQMRENGYGRIVFTTSSSGLFGNFGQSNYAAAKMGLVGLCNVVALEGASKGILANVVAPVARTRHTEQMLGEAAAAFDPEHVSALVAYLCSEQCTVTHEIFSAGAGRYARAFVGLTPGWFAGTGRRPTAEEVGENLQRIREPEGFTIPDSAQDELLLLSRLVSEEARV